MQYFILLIYSFLIINKATPIPVGEGCLLKDHCTEAAEQFGNDLVNNADLAAEVIKNPKIIDSWDVLSKNPSARTNVVDLNLIGKKIDEAGGDITGLKNSFDDATDKRQFLDDLFENEVNDAAADFFSSEPDEIVKEIIEGAILNNDKEKLRDLFNIKPSNNKNVGSTGKDYQITGENIFDGEIDGEYSELFPNLVYYDDAARKPLEVTVKNGNLLNASGDLADQSNLIYVMDQKGNIFATSQELGKIHHSSLVYGADVAAAGEIRFIDDTIVISRKSGHYHPEPEGIVFSQIVTELTARGVDINKIKLDPAL